MSSVGIADNFSSRDFQMQDIVHVNGKERRAKNAPLRNTLGDKPSFAYLVVTISLVYVTDNGVKHCSENIEN